MRIFGFAGTGGFFYSIVSATVGAVLFTWVYRKLGGGSPTVKHA